MVGQRAVRRGPTRLLLVSKCNSLGPHLILMKALLKSRVVAKSPPKNAPGIRGLCRAKATLEAKGYTGAYLIGLLIATHRLWALDRMEEFVLCVAPSAASAASD